MGGGAAVSAPFPASRVTACRLRSSAGISMLCSVSAARFPRTIGGLGRAEHELGLTDLHAIAVPELLRILHAPRVQEHAVDAAEVLERHRAARDHELRMPARDQRVVEHDVARRAPADLHGAGAKLDGLTAVLEPAATLRRFSGIAHGSGEGAVQIFEGQPTLNITVFRSVSTIKFVTHTRESSSR
jgi:hypothetical protein